MELKPGDRSATRSADFWPGALKSVTYEGVKTYGMPDQQRDDGADLERGKLFKAMPASIRNPRPRPGTTSSIYSKAIQDKTRHRTATAWWPAVNAGNTPFRFMPQLWAYRRRRARRGLSENPGYKSKCTINNDADRRSRPAGLPYDMYVRDKSVPVSALTNTQAENQGPFIAGESRPW
jgi:multiple sugar transport system substrate-binding protein